MDLISRYTSVLQSTHNDEGPRKEAKSNFDVNTRRANVESESRTARSVVDFGNGDKGKSEALERLSLDSSPRPKELKKPKKPKKRPQQQHQGEGLSWRRDRSIGSESQNPNEWASQVGHAPTFTSNWRPNGEPTRELVNPLADSNPKAPPAQTKLSLRTAQPSGSEQQTLPVVASSAQPAQGNQERGMSDARWPEMMPQPESRRISQEQLAAEVKWIYTGLTMIESKCIHVDRAQVVAMHDGQYIIRNNHWQALIALHRTLLHEHHDFFLASQHPSASWAIRRLASKYSMPARMWKYGIHSFLELLRYQLPDSLEFMINFIYTAYQMISLLYETVPAFKNTWIECLGDLGRYRMAIDNGNVRDHENWANVSRFWYTKAADRSPEVGRLYHHLAILARPNALQQLFLYSRSLISVQIFNPARETILTLFKPILGRSDAASSHTSQLDTSFIKASAILFTKEHLDDFKHFHDGFIELLDQHIGRVTAEWRVQGVWVIVSLLGALFDYGNDSPLRRVFELGFHQLAQQARDKSQADQSASFDPQHAQSDGDTVMENLNVPTTVDSESKIAFEHALKFYTSVVTSVLRRLGDENVLPFVHILLAFLLSLIQLKSLDSRIKSSYIVKTILARVPLGELCSFLNILARSDSADARYETKTFIRGEDSIPLPEDHLIRGQVWAQNYFPADLFKSSELDDEERNIEHASTVRMRAERVLNLGFRLAQEHDFGIKYDIRIKTFNLINHPNCG
ncbi:uncharacterized protein PV09_09809 [Verruconis gallopava]|uniref:DNA/RNA-binding domain-containing protein n=1 Tax=Verruconis gallopava TaxID=253628 RepID=A0A0D1YCD7_9PEZI|nr:uncharacterized protein PV09_09809 [Verruconis gallopava]KIV98351.1 hypothetical protein PV09_09809 [Verruconis gallopava]